jgi:hypothetical protein
MSPTPSPFPSPLPANFGSGTDDLGDRHKQREPVEGAIATLTDGIDGTSHGMTFHETAVTNSGGQATFTVTVPEGTPILYTPAPGSTTTTDHGTIGGVGVEGGNHMQAFRRLRIPCPPARTL